MATRRRSFVYVVADALWWVSPLLAGTVYLFLQYGLPMLAADPASEAAYGRLAEDAWLIALLLLVPAPFAAIAARQERRRRADWAYLDKAPRRRAARTKGAAPAAASPDADAMSGLIRLCPRCGSKMVVRTLSSGPQAGQQVWGCSAFPRCRATEPYEG